LSWPPQKTGGGAKAPEGYVVLCKGPMCTVMIRETVQKRLLKDATKEQRAGLHDVVERYANGGPANVPPKKYNGAEGWFPSRNDKRVRLEALKAWQLRAYGFCQQFGGRQTFFITGADASKKQDAANPAILAAAGAEAVRVHEVLK
jgi:hypothetical protein